VFQGHSNTTIDEKGRLIIPAKFRKHIPAESNSVMNLTLGRDNCIWLFPSTEWMKVMETVKGTNPYTQDEVAMRRQMLFYTDEITIDSQHRILIPQELTKIVGIKKDVLLIGQIERVELWNPQSYEKYLKGSKDSYEDVMQKVMTKHYDGNGSGNGGSNNSGD
jgi:MraZ protein